MPSKVQIDENLVFLYRCLVNSDCKTIDFNAVGVVTNLKAPAARMRYSRLKKNIETKLRAASKLGTSAKAPAGSAISLATKKIIHGRRPSKKRKIMHESEGEESVVPTHNEKMSSATIKGEEFQEWRAGPRTRAKKVDLRDSFESNSDSDSSGLSELGVRDAEDDYDIEHVSEGEEDFSADEAEDHEADQPVLRRRKSSIQSAKRNMSTTESTKILFEEPSKANPHSVPRNYAIENGSKPGVPVTPERGLPGRSDSARKSIPTGAIRQEPADSTWTIFKTRPDTPQLFPTAKPKIRRYASPPPSLFDHIENARIQADYNLASLSYPTNKRSRSAHDGQTTNSETILPSIEHDEEEEEVDEGRTMMKTSSESSTRRSASTTGNGDDDIVIFQAHNYTARVERHSSSAALSSLSHQTELNTTAPATAQAIPSPQAAVKATIAELCIVQ